MMTKVLVNQLAQIACMVQMMTKVLHVNQQHKLHGVDDDKGTSCKSTTHIAWCR